MAFNQWHPGQRVATFAIGGLAFIALIITSALLGIHSAETRLPASASLPEGYPPGTRLLVGKEGEVLYLSDSAQSLRDYFFSYPTSPQRRRGDAETRGLRRLFTEIEIRTIEQDADTVRVELLSGPLQSKIYWVHVSQLPPLK